jgi:multidrug resistance efflux pump
MTTTTLNFKYENGQRIVEQLVTYDKSDDLFALANFQRRYERISKELEGVTEQEEIERLQENLETIKAEINEQQKIVDGYEEASE